MYTNKRTLLNEMVAEGIERALRIGATLAEAAQAEGVSKRTVQRWMEYGEAYERAIDDGREPNPDHEAFAEFRQKVVVARSKARVAAAGVVLRAALGEIRRDEDGNVIEVIREQDWKAAAWYLERTDPETWGRRNRPVEADARDEEESIDDATHAAERLVSAAAEQIAREAAGEV